MASGLPGASPTRILVFVPQQSVAELIKLTLNHGVCITEEVTDGPGAMAALDEWKPDLAVIDVEAAGDEVLQRIARPAGGDREGIPVLGLTRRGDLKTKLAAFDQGADDIMTVPFSPEELLARVLVIACRSAKQPIPLNPVLKLGEIEIDILNRQVRIDDKVLHLTGVEQSLLYLLAANAGRVLTRDDIMDAIWGMDFVSDSNIVDRHIRNLRVKLQNGWHEPRFIATVPGQGYRFLPSFEEGAPAGRTSSATTLHRYRRHTRKLEGKR